MSALEKNENMSQRKMILEIIRREYTWIGRYFWQQSYYFTLINIYKLF